MLPGLRENLFAAPPTVTALAGNDSPDSIVNRPLRPVVGGMGRNFLSSSLAVVAGGGGGASSGLASGESVLVASVVFFALALCLSGSPANPGTTNARLSANRQSSRSSNLILPPPSGSTSAPAP